MKATKLKCFIANGAGPGTNHKCVLTYLHYGFSGNTCPLLHIHSRTLTCIIIFKSKQMPHGSLLMLQQFATEFNSTTPALCKAISRVTMLGYDLCMSWLTVTFTRFQYNQSCSSCLVIKLISLLSKNEFPNAYCKHFLMDVLFLS